MGQVRRVLVSIVAHRVAVALFVNIVSILWLVSCTRQTNSLSVYAASSLTEAFQELARRFKAMHGGQKISLVFSGSQILRLQIEHGAPADVFASADASHMNALSSKKLIEVPKIFARNKLVLIVPSFNPSKIRSFRDLPHAKRLVLGTKEVPIGRYTRAALRATDALWGVNFRKKVMSRVASEESNVRLVRAKVALGEADAAIVYATDVPPSAQIRRITLPARVQPQISYWFAVLKSTRHAKAAKRWVSFVRSSDGQAILRRHGFMVTP